MHVQPPLCCFPFLWDQRFQGKVLFFFFFNWFEFIYRPPKRYSLLSLIHNRSAGKHWSGSRTVLSYKLWDGQGLGTPNYNYLIVYTFNQDQCILKGTFSLRSSFSSRPANTILISLGSTPCL